MNSRTYFICSRNASSDVPFNFINHPPLILLNKTISGQCGGKPCSRFAREYSSDEDTFEARYANEIQSHIGAEFPFMQLQPHVCDFEWLHSATLGWVELENVDPNAENVDYWMRMSERFDEITFVIKNSSDLRRECLQHGSSDTRCDSSEKMRFMGLRSADIMFLSDDSPQEIVTRKANSVGCVLLRFFHMEESN